MLPLRATVDLGQCHWRGTPHSPKLQHYWNLIIRLFSVISSILVGGLTPLLRFSRCILPPQPTRQVDHVVKAIQFSLTFLFQAIQFSLTFLFQAIQFSLTFLFQAIKFSVSTISMSKIVLSQTIQFSISMQISSMGGKYDALVIVQKTKI